MGKNNFETYLTRGGTITQEIQDAIDEKSSEFIEFNQYSNANDEFTAFANIPGMPNTLLLESEYAYVEELAAIMTGDYWTIS